jgi:hypothetical protein
MARVANVKMQAIERVGSCFLFALVAVFPIGELWALYFQDVTFATMWNLSCAITLFGVLIVDNYILKRMLQRHNQLEERRRQIGPLIGLFGLKGPRIVQRL